MPDLSTCQLYFIADYRPGINRHCLPDMVSRAIAGGADIIQLRYKNSERNELLQAAERVIRITSSQEIPLIINDDPEVALEVGAAGVHLGQVDMPIERARELLGKDKIIGLSTHSVEEAIEAEEKGADYIGIGPIFYTTTKQPVRTPLETEILQQLSTAVKIPFYPIGGLNADNIDLILTPAARRAAVASCIGEAHDIKQSAQQLKSKLTAVII
ncbi:MAG: thiamine phosphate synthase [bacterium]